MPQATLEPASTANRSACAIAWLRSRVVLAIIFTKFTEGCLFFFGANGVKTGITPQNFTWFRYVFSSMLLHSMLWISSGKPPWQTLPRKKDLGIFLIYGCCHAYFGQYCLFIAFQYIPAVNATVWSNLSGVFVCIIGFFFGVELITKQAYSAHLKLSGTAVGIVGAMVYVYLTWKWDGGSKDPEDPNPLLGNLWIFVSVLGGAFYHVFQKVVLNEGYTSLETVTWGGTIGLIVMCAIVVPNMDGATFDMSQKQWIYVLYAALMPTGLCIWINGWAVKYSSPLFVVAANPLSTITSASLKFVVDGTTPTNSTYISTPIILVGMYLLVWGRAREVKTGLSSDEDRHIGESSAALASTCRTCGQPLSEAVPLDLPRSSSFDIK